MVFKWKTALERELSCGEDGIRTHGTFARTTDFKSVAFDHSATSDKDIPTRRRDSASNLNLKS